MTKLYFYFFAPNLKSVIFYTFVDFKNIKGLNNFNYN